MKKKLEADLISIAHRILQLKNKSDVNLLFLETQKLYEKLSVLRFVEEHFGDAKPTIGHLEIETIIEDVFDNDIVLPTDSNKVEDLQKVVVEEKIEVPLVKSVEKLIEKEVIVEKKLENHIVTEFKPTFELSEDDKIEEPKKPEVVQISFEELLGKNYKEAQFVKLDQAEKEVATKVIEKAKKIDFQEKEKPEAEKVILENIESKKVSANEKLVKGLNIDLNDRIAFVKHLFGNSIEDYNRVLNQLITYNSFHETKDFIDEMVKPDYNNWEGKEDYEQRFMEIIEKKFM